MAHDKPTSTSFPASHYKVYQSYEVQVIFFVSPKIQKQISENISLKASQQGCPFKPLKSDSEQ